MSEVQKATVASQTTGGKPAGAATITPSKTPPFQLQTTKSSHRYLKLLIYGNYGSGKTTLAASSTELPHMQDVFLINAEAGDLAIDQMDHVDAVTVKDYRMLSVLKDFLVAHCQARDAGDMDKLCELDAKVRPEPLPKDIPVRQYRTVIIDSLSEVETYCMYQLLGISDNTRLDEEVASAEWSEYKRNHNMILRLVRNFRDLPMNVIFICAEQFTQDEVKKMKYAPALTGKLSKQVQGFMDMVGYLQTGAPKDDGTIPRRLSVLPTGRFDAKHRFSTFKGSYFDEPSMKSILTQVGLLPDPSKSKA